MQALLTWSAGKKTYGVVVLSLVYAAIGFYVLKTLSVDQALQLVQVALGLGGLRAAIK